MILCGANPIWVPLLRSGEIVNFGVGSIQGGIFNVSSGQVKLIFVWRCGFVYNGSLDSPMTPTRSQSITTQPIPNEFTRTEPIRN